MSEELKKLDEILLELRLHMTVSHPPELLPEPEPPPHSSVNVGVVFGVIFLAVLAAGALLLIVILAGQQ